MQQTARLYGAALSFNFLKFTKSAFASARQTDLLRRLSTGVGDIFCVAISLLGSFRRDRGVVVFRLLDLLYFRGRRGGRNGLAVCKLCLLDLLLLFDWHNLICHNSKILFGRQSSVFASLLLNTAMPASPSLLKRQAGPRHRRMRRCGDQSIDRSCGGYRVLGDHEPVTFKSSASHSCRLLSGEVPHFYESDLCGTMIVSSLCQGQVQQTSRAAQDFRLSGAVLPPARTTLRKQRTAQHSQAVLDNALPMSQDLEADGKRFSVAYTTIFCCQIAETHSLGDIKHSLSAICGYQVRQADKNVHYAGNILCRPPPSGKHNGKQYHIHTFGCQMNLADSERMAGVLDTAGYTCTQDASEADVLIYNTCSIRDKAEQKVYSALGKQVRLRQEASDSLFCYQYYWTRICPNDMLYIIWLS